MLAIRYTNPKSQQTSGFVYQPHRGFEMIEWIKPKSGGRAGSSAYIAISVTSAGASSKHRAGQLVMRFGREASKNLRLIAGDRVVIGLDPATKQVCFKRTTDSHGYKLTGKSGSSLTVQATMDLPILSVQVIEMADVKIESTHVAIKCPELFKPIVSSAA